jgi:hypothetical protein
MSNFIKITDTLAIASDDKQWKIREYTGMVNRKNKDGSVTAEENWESVGYYPTLEMCVNQLGQYMLRKGSADSWKSLVSDANEISLLLGQKFTASAEIRIK